MGDRTSLPGSHSSSWDKERRKHLRREPRQLVYIDLGPDNCGFILDVSEGGISFKGISSLRDGETLKVRFRLPGTDLSIQAEGQFVRAGSTANSSVLRFQDVPYDVRMQIREWVVLAELEESISSEPPVPSGDPAIPSFQPAKKNRLDGFTPAGHDGIAPMSSIFAHGIPTNGDGTIFLTTPHPDTSIQAASSKMPKAADAAPNSPQEKLPVGENTLTGTAGHDRWSEHDDIKNAEWPKKPFELTIRPAPKASSKANPAPKATSEAVPAATAKQSRTGKNFQMSQFTAGIVVGCVVLASAGGGLIATGRVRLVKSPAPSSVAAPASPAPSSSEAGTANVEGQNSPSQHPVITPNGLITTQPDSSVPSVPAAPKVPSATTPIRDESLRKDPARKESVAKQPATSSSKNANPKAQKVAQAALVELPQVSEPVRKTEPASSMQLSMSRPVEQARTAPARSDAQAPSIPAAAAQSLPEVGAAMPAAVSQVAVASGAPETFASPQIEEKPTRAEGTAKITQSSSPVFAAPDPSGAKPSSIEPAQLVLHVEPVYPAAARAAKIQGSVDILATIGKDGVPRSLEAVNGDPGLAAAAIAAVSNWRYRPAMLNGQFEESLITITVKFAF